MTDIVPSEELRALMLRLYAAWEANDFETLRDLFSARPQLLTIGTDPGEWRTGPAATDVWTVQTQEVGGVRFTSHDLIAYTMGNVGWIADDVTIRTSVETRVRLTAVAVIERGHWRIVQWHTSVGRMNEEAYGAKLTTALERLERSVRDDRPDMRTVSAPDGTVTIAFTDIESSAVVMERLGDTAFLRLLAWHDRIVRDTAEAHRGFVVKSQGDGFMLAFPSAAAALRAVLIARERIAAGFEGLPVRIRAGLHSGEAIKQDDDFYGRTVVIAARISALALGGEILVSDLVHALTRSLGTFKFGESRSATLKGLEGAFELYPLLA